MADSPVTVDRLSWRDLVPSLVICRALPTSLTMTVLVLSLFAVVATPIGWIGMEKLVVSVDSELANDADFQAVAEINRSPWRAVYPKWNETGSVLTVMGHQMLGVELIFKAAINSIRGAFSLESGIWRFAYFLVGAIWTLLVWSFFGCAITRTALMRYTREESIGIDDAFDYAMDKFLSCFGGIAIPLLAIAGLTIPIALLGLIMSTNIGAALGGLLWFVALTIALIIAVIILGLMFAWPLIVSAISCEGQDSFDGMSRAFAYVFQRPVQYLAYAVIAVLFSGICWLIASAVIEGAIHTANWAASWGINVFDDSRAAKLTGYSAVSDDDDKKTLVAPSDIVESARQEANSGRRIAVPRPDSEPDLISKQGAESSESVESASSATLTLGKRMIKFWNGVARAIGAAFLYGLFWCMAAAIYLLLRKDLDDTEMDEIYLVDERRTYELPPLKDDPGGVPQIDEDAELPAKVEPPPENSGDANDES